MKARKYFSFGQELVFQQIDVSALKREGLQRVVNAELRVLDLVNGTHSALTEKANDSISSDQLSGCQFHFFHGMYLCCLIIPYSPCLYQCTVKSSSHRKIA